MKIIALLNQALKKKIINDIDFHFATHITTENQPELMLAAVCVSYTTNCGHVCLPIFNLENQLVFPKKEKKFTNKLWNLAGNPKNWTKILLNSSIVSYDTNLTPLVLLKNNLYLNYLWQAEKKVSLFILNNKEEKNNVKLSKKTLKSLFNGKNDNFQKIAVAMTMIRKTTFIIGGPGTGKTTVVAKILLALIRISKKKMKIKLTAPTGKSTARLSESLTHALKKIKSNPLEKNMLPKHAVTLHTLLGITKKNKKPFFNRNNLLNIDVLIIDESSMLDLLLMEKLIDALPKKTKVIFLGDINQLPPVEPGSILKDIYNNYHYAYSQKTAKTLEKITECKINTIDNLSNNDINDSICILKKKYRFNSISNISKLEEDLNKNKLNLVNKIFFNKYKNIIHYEINNNKEYINMIKNIIKGYIKYLNYIKKNKNIKDIMKKFNKYRVICAVKNGIYGIKKINIFIEETMEKMNLIESIQINNNTWYIGKPILITKNNKSLGLFNGDIGITLLDNKKILKIFFVLPCNNIKIIPIELIYEYETTWAMTIHKSQGSEFEHTVIILPDKDQKVLTKELFYTAITRARNKLTIYSKKKILSKIIKKKNVRYSGLNNL
ncbi:exodeoxyribonuclease V subunit alpha [Buchnera aphidicola (Pemphigus obesinymphae)]|uniref:exodeoxyribonuclease V subunit alpha n=1 Tax=Buchnera aphidicola TaxID=9 RepID=UPI0022378D9B|nr:exodeoxyribonuclease V subunit alpha [Buchnera aphidicola]MCW5196365.1 exodeoxyribonuclease V subunit alpha [Buchnera aphidicola (Pemphigus obesinymphae)]